mmetsp:Transcript_10723/g.20864  ORF Transcript_10723/g.20864 Transcript_10723/m.20864 type:complete len:228 (+) Transcript_10723:1638-2321(+)
MKFVMWVVLLGENELGCGFVRWDVEYFGQFCFCIEANLGNLDEVSISEFPSINRKRKRKIIILFSSLLRLLIPYKHDQIILPVIPTRIQEHFFHLIQITQPHNSVVQILRLIRHFHLPLLLLPLLPLILLPPLLVLSPLSRPLLTTLFLPHSKLGIINPLLFRIRENFIRLGHLTELLGRRERIVWIFIGVGFLGFGSVGFLDLIGCGAMVDGEGGVWVEGGGRVLV